MNQQQQTIDPRLEWIAQALQDAAQALPPAARAAYIAKAGADLGVIARDLLAGSQAAQQDFVPVRDQAEG
jgi:hypothetical protein